MTEKITFKVKTKPSRSAAVPKADFVAAAAAELSPRSAGVESRRLQEAGSEKAASGQYSTALSMWDEAIGLHERGSLHESRAQVLLQLGRTFEAVQSASRAVELDNSWADGHLTLARAQLNLGEPEMALESIQRCLQLEPENTQAAAEISEIRTLVQQRSKMGSVNKRLRVD